MENFLSLTILTFIVVYLIYDWLQRNKKRKSQNLKPENTSSTTLSTSVNPKGDLQTGSDPKVPEHLNSEHLPESAPSQISEEPINLETKISQIEDLVEKGLFGGLDKEKCLIEIKKIINK